jgi:hypothetical protein
MKRTLVIELTLTSDAAPSPAAERDIREAVRDLGDTLAYLGKVTRCELRPSPAPVAEPQKRTP